MPDFLAARVDRKIKHGSSNNKLQARNVTSVWVEYLLEFIAMRKFLHNISIEQNSSAITVHFQIKLIFLTN